MLIREKPKSYKKRMGKPSRKAKANFPGKISYVIKKKRDQMIIMKELFLTHKERIREVWATETSL